ncbi:MAG: hypothetical protein M9885_14730 [Burkholderiaceae bacterium]|nr:hypothetical protein [Burkholderiaceae bacterium]
MIRPKSPHTTPSLIAVAIASLTLAACGGGGGGGDGGGGGGPATPQSISGTVVDGYMSAASMRCVAGSGTVASTTSAADGSFSFSLPAGQSCSSIEAFGGIDAGVTPDNASDDIPRPAALLRAPVPAGTASLSDVFVTPASTLIDALVSGGTSISDAQDLVRARLGVSNTDLLGTNPASDVSLYRANAALAQILEQVAAAISAAGGIGDDAGRRAVSDATIGALAAMLSGGTTLAQLNVAPDTLTPGSPLVALIDRATRNARASAATGSGLADVQPETLSLLAAPLVASAAQQVTQAPNLLAIVAAAGDIDERGGAAPVIGGLGNLLGEVPTAGQPQALLDAMAAAAQSAAAGTTDTASLTVGSASAVAQVPGGVSNFAKVADSVRLYGPSGSPTTVTVAQFGSSAGVAVQRNLAKVGITLDESDGATQLLTPREVPLAIDVRDASGPRVVQVLVDRVTVSQDAGGTVEASLPDGATFTVYGKTATAETTSPLVIVPSGAASPITTTAGGEIEIDIERLFSIIGGAAGAGSPLAQLAATGISNGTFDVTLVVGDLRIAHSTSSSNPAPVLGEPLTVRLQAGSQVVSGRGLKGRVVVGG